ncbi:alpha-tocopherol transfer protein-like [Ptychodera flava]|uniref:alpha-tocopherol transfer protein-like n=1 Tax=Ptychodera flava TaxID=63121 RepID=UPI003969CA28
MRIDVANERPLDPVSQQLNMATTHQPYVCTLSNELQKKAEDELNERSDTRQQHINALREKTKTRPDIKFRTDDAFLLRFLRARKFDVDRAFKNLVRYYDIRQEYPDIFDDLSVEKLKHVWEAGLEGMFPGKDKLGRRVGVFRPGKWDPDICSSKDMFKASILTIEKMLEDEETQINGLVFIGDFADYSMKQAVHSGPSMAKLNMSLLQNAMPLRSKGVHFVNTPTIFDTLMSVWRPFMTEKMKSRMNIHGDDFTTLHQHISSANLPSDYGGTQPEATECTKQWMKELAAWEDGFKAENSKYGIPKKKDTLGGGKVAADPSGGLVGTFKKLDI